MTQIIVFTNPEDLSRVSILTPTGESSIDELIHLHIDTSKPYKIMDEHELPSDDYMYFEAWKLIENDIQVDIEKAKDIHRKNLRQQRIERFTALDIQFMRAIEENDIVAQQEIAAKKQKLRNIPSHTAISNATNTIQLRELTLDFLLTH